MSAAISAARLRISDFEHGVIDTRACITYILNYTQIEKHGILIHRARNYRGCRLIVAIGYGLRLSALPLRRELLCNMHTWSACPVPQSSAHWCCWQLDVAITTFD